VQRVRNVFRALYAAAARRQEELAPVWALYGTETHRGLVRGARLGKKPASE
jgi:hypothetical protein